MNFETSRLIIPLPGPLTSNRDGQESIDPPLVLGKRRRMQALLWLRDSEVQVIRPGPASWDSCWVSLNVLGA